MAKRSKPEIVDVEALRAALAAAELRADQAVRLADEAVLRADEAQAAVGRAEAEAAAVKAQLSDDAALIAHLRLVIARLIRIGALEDSTLASRALAPYRLVACAAPAYLARRGRPDHPGELGRHACLDYAFPARLGPPLWRFTSGSSEVEVAPAARLVVSDSRSLIDAALNGGGIILAAEILLQDHLAAGRLVRVLPGYEGLSRSMHLLFAERRAQVPKLRVFIDWTSEVFGRRAVPTDSPSL